MQKVILGKTGIEVSKNSFGALPIQRISKKDAVYLLQKAFYQGINYFDTARLILTVKKSWEKHYRFILEKVILSQPKQWQQHRMNLEAATTVTHITENRLY